MGKIASAEIPYKFPSFNEYIRICRGNMFVANKYKQQIEINIGYALNRIPAFTKPIFINFTWVEGNNKRDWDNVTYAKKFILDALVKLGKLPNDSRKYVKGYSDHGAYEKGIWKVIVEIKEIDEEGGESWSK